MLERFEVALLALHEREGGREGGKKRGREGGRKEGREGGRGGEGQSYIELRRIFHDMPFMSINLVSKGSLP